MPNKTVIKEIVISTNVQRKTTTSQFLVSRRT